MLTTKQRFSSEPVRQWVGQSNEWVTRIPIVGQVFIVGLAVGFYLWAMWDWSLQLRSTIQQHRHRRNLTLRVILVSLTLTTLVQGSWIVYRYLPTPTLARTKWRYFSDTSSSTKTHKRRIELPLLK